MQSNGKEELLSKKKNNDLVFAMLLKQQNQEIQELSQEEVKQQTQKSKFLLRVQKTICNNEQQMIYTTNRELQPTGENKKQKQQNNRIQNTQCLDMTKIQSSGMKRSRIQNVHLTENIFSKTSSCISVVSKRFTKELKLRSKKRNNNNTNREISVQKKNDKEILRINDYSTNYSQNIFQTQNQQSDEKLSNFPSLDSLTNDVGYETQQISNIKINNQFYINSLVGYLQDFKQDIFMAQMYMSHFVQIYENLRSSKLLQKPETYTLSTKVAEISNKQKTLVLDLDETLVHLNEYAQLQSDIFIPVNYEGKAYKAGVSVRPHAYEFLKNMAQYYEIIVFTASSSHYAEKIVANLDPEKNLIQHCLYREDCVEISKNCHIKDLRILGRNLKDVVLVDNSANSFAYQIENGIPIIPYLDNKNDNELLYLQNYLIDLILVDDVREINQQMFNLKIVQNCDSIQQAIKNIVSISNKTIC